MGLPSLIEDQSVGSKGARPQLRCRPFLKWVGGKQQLLPELIKRVPLKIYKYYEPFIGGGALFYALKPRKAYLSDLNPDLMNAYQVVQNDVEALIVELSKHYYDEKHFYEVRDADRSPGYETWTPVAQAARLLFLNKTCFNGLYRVNARGFFNTPFGRYSKPKIVDEENLRACSRALKGSSIHTAGFESIEEKITPHDFVYFDPPYVPLSATSNFESYAKEGFGPERQLELYKLCVRLTEKKVRFMLSNSSAPMVLDLYKKFKVERVPASRAINSKGQGRGKIDEVIVTNF